MKRYFFDSYALIELVKSDQNYIKYLEEDVTITIFNLAEVYYSILKDFGEEKAKEIYFKFKNCIVEVEVEDESIFMAMKLKIKFKNLSYADCIGYSYALINDLKFLTGDRDFIDFQNVEFVK